MRPSIPSLKDRPPRISIRPDGNPILPPPVTASPSKSATAAVAASSRKRAASLSAFGDDRALDWSSRLRSMLAGSRDSITTRLWGARTAGGPTWISLLWDRHPSHARRDSDRLLDGAKTPKGWSKWGAAVDNARRRLALSRRSAFIVLVLLVLGMREVIQSPSKSTTLLRTPLLKGRSPAATLAALVPAGRATHPLGALSMLADYQVVDVDGIGRDGVEVRPGMGDTTAIVLNWRRLDNVKVVVAQLCSYTFFDKVVVWNNNPESFLELKTFATSLCPASKLRIVNSPQNMFFLSRYLACASVSTQYCYFQDDDWIVHGLRSAYEVFKRDPEGAMVGLTDRIVSVLGGWEWCFFNSPLHTCFSWVGTGAFVSRAHVLDYLYSISLAQPLSTRNTLSPYSNAELAHADNSFTTFLNRPSILLTGGLTPLVGRRQKEKKGVAYSEGEGIARNKDFIQRGLGRLIASLVFPPSALAPATSYDSTSQDTPSLIELPEPQPVDTYKFKATPEPPLEKHPWAHHTRAICASDTCTFITNVPLLPPPDTVPYPVRTHLNLSVSAIDEPVLRPPTLDEWENHLGITGRGGWTEGGLDGRELFGEGERWALRYGYENAVDGDWTTAFRSANTVEKDDYVGLALVRGLDQIWTPKVTLHFLLGGIEAIAPGLLIEVSVDGYTWQPPSTLDGKLPLPVCTLFRSPSSLHSPGQSTKSPFPVLPRTFLSTPESSNLISHQEQTGQPGFWTRLFGLGSQIEARQMVCEVDISSAVFLSSRQQQDVGEEGKSGWKFVRLRSELAVKNVGWTVWELWLR